MNSPAEKPLPPLTPWVSLLYLSLYLHYGFVAFIPVWLKDRGIAPAAIGGLMAIPLILRILTVAPVAGYVGRTGRVRLAMLAATLASSALIVGLGLMHGTIAVAIAMVLFSLAWDQIPVLIDAYAVMAVQAQKLDFGRIRVWGSIAVIISSAAAGWAISKIHIGALPFLIAGLLLLPAALMSRLPSDNRLAVAVHQDGPPERGAWRKLLGDRPLMAGMLAISLIVGSGGVFASFSAIQWTSAGISTTMIGVLNATAVVSELAFFWFGQKALGDRDPRLMLGAAAVACALRWLIMATSPTLPILVVAQLLQGAGATGAILGMMLLISRRAPLRLTSAANGMYAVILGVVLAGVTAVSGLIWAWGPPLSYTAMAALALTGLIPLMLLRDRRPTPVTA